MSKIRVLPEILANKIAAGEIIERPASVVKELLENSIDAASHAVHVSVQAGGRKLITVRDDGGGMSQDDAILAFEHHATNKIETANDLSAIATLGFRGEALPSIASISRLILRTRPSEDTGATPGTEIQIQGGVLRGVRPIPWDKGTEVTVHDLFFNVPARRKFLRSHDTELGHITRLVTHYALAFPQMRYRLDSDGRVLLDCPPAGSLRDRVYQIFGEDFLKNLLEIEGQADDVSVNGFCSQPHEQRTNPYSQFFYVNRRMVRDKVISSAVRKAYQNCIPASAYPVVLILLEMPYEEVDVNAHPAKTEVRFRDQSLVHSLVMQSIQRALIGGRAIPVFEHRADPWQNGSFPPFPESVNPSTIASSDSVGGESTRREVPLSTIQRAFNYSFRSSPPALPDQSPDHQSLAIRQDLLLEAPPQANAPYAADQIRIIGQLHDSYIIAADSQGLLIIDQHVAHERILYERFAQSLRQDNPEIQHLLVPIALELQPHQVAIWRRVMPELARNGFQVEQFGGNSVLVRTVPAIAAELDMPKLLTEILDGLDAEERTLDVGRIRNRFAVSMACRAAIKVHMPLNMEKMQWLLDELFKTLIPTNCPHGRPIILRFSLYEIERNFGRI